MDNFQQAITRKQRFTGPTFAWQFFILLDLESPREIITFPPITLSTETSEESVQFESVSRALSANIVIKNMTNTLAEVIII